MRTVYTPSGANSAPLTEVVPAACPVSNSHNQVGLLHLAGVVACQRTQVHIGEVRSRDALLYLLSAGLAALMPRSGLSPISPPTHLDIPSLEKRSSEPARHRQWQHETVPGEADNRPTPLEVASPANPSIRDALFITGMSGSHGGQINDLSPTSNACADIVRSPRR